MKHWRCTICNQILEGEQPPISCPVCGAGADAFELVQETVPEEPTAVSLVRRYLLVGGGVAALEAAKSIRKQDPAGHITMVCEENAIPYSRPGLSDLVAGTSKFSDLLLKPMDWYTKNEIHLLCGVAVTKIDHTTRIAHLSNGQTVGYDRLLLATGATAFNPVQTQPGGPSVQVLHTVTDAYAALQLAGSSVLVVGGGILGVEAALALHTQGCQVAICEVSDRLLALQADAEVSRRLKEALEKAGIRVLCGTTVQTASCPVLLQNGETIKADAILVSIGIRSELALAKQLGVICEKGIVVDEAMQTSLPNIYAAGDCAQFGARVSGLHPAASMMGMTAGANMAGKSAVYRPLPPATTLDEAGIRMVSIGTVTAELFASYSNGSEYRAVYAENGRVIGVLLWGRVNQSVTAAKAVREGANPQKICELLEML